MALSQVGPEAVGPRAKCEEIRPVKNMTLKESSVASNLMPRATVATSQSVAAKNEA